MAASNEFILWTFRLDEDRYNERASWKVPLKPALRVWSRLKKKKEWFELKRRKEDPRGEVQFEFPASRVHSSSTEGRVVNEMADRQQLAIARSQLIVCRGSRRRMVDRFIAPKKYIDDNKKRLLFDNEFIDSFFQKLLTRSKRISNLNKKINPTQQYDIRLEYTKYRDKIGKLKFNYIGGEEAKVFVKLLLTMEPRLKFMALCRPVTSRLFTCSIAEYQIISLRSLLIALIRNFARLGFRFK